GYTPAELMNALFDRYKIHTVGIDYEGVRCIRVTPHVYTTLADLDRFVNAIGELAAGKKA
ncbi:aminotransferase, partial [Terriglobus sp. YAF25]